VILIITAGAELNGGGRYNVIAGGTVVKTCDNRIQLLPYTSHTSIKYGLFNPVIDKISIAVI
jgi:hypothetical protein